MRLPVAVWVRRLFWRVTVTVLPEALAVRSLFRVTSLPVRTFRLSQVMEA